METMPDNITHFHSFPNPCQISLSEPGAKREARIQSPSIRCRRERFKKSTEEPQALIKTVNIEIIKIKAAGKTREVKESKKKKKGLWQVPRVPDYSSTAFSSNQFQKSR